MTPTKWITPLLAGSMMFTAIATPMVAKADGDNWYHNHRQQQKNTWGGLTLAGGLLAGLGLATNNGTLTTIGVVGGLYSAYRLSEDGSSHDRIYRARAELYRQPYFDYDGNHYVRTTVWDGGHEYYRFVDQDRRRNDDGWNRGDDRRDDGWNRGDDRRDDGWKRGDDRRDDGWKRGDDRRDDGWKRGDNRDNGGRQGRDQGNNRGGNRGGDRGGNRDGNRGRDR